MNPFNGSPSLPASAGPATATAPHQHHDPPWPGLVQAAAPLGVSIDPVAASRLDHYRNVLLERSAQFNLTAIRDPQAIEQRLFLDALAMLPEIDQFLRNNRRPRDAHPRLIDVGSGAGFPGLVLKIARPDLDVTLADATAKKVRFMNEVVSGLQLDGVRAIHARAENLGQDPAYRERFDLATARAVGSLPVLLELVVPLLDVGGQAFFPKGTDIDDELKAGKRAARKLGAEILSASEIPPGGTRLVVVAKTTLTRGVYPRRPGIPRQSPLGQGA